MIRIHPESFDADPPDWSVAADVIFREEPDEDEDGGEEKKKNEDDDDTDDGYSEWVGAAVARLGHSSPL
jgi:hypothetical protein